MLFVHLETKANNSLCPEKKHIAIILTNIFGQSAFLFFSTFKPGQNEKYCTNNEPTLSFFPQGVHFQSLLHKIWKKEYSDQMLLQDIWNIWATLISNHLNHFCLLIFPEFRVLIATNLVQSKYALNYYLKIVLGF